MAQDMALRMDSTRKMQNEHPVESRRFSADGGRVNATLPMSSNQLVQGARVREDAYARVVDNIDVPLLKAYDADSADTIQNITQREFIPPTVDEARKLQQKYNALVSDGQIDEYLSQDALINHGIAGYVPPTRDEAKAAVRASREANLVKEYIELAKERMGGSYVPPSADEMRGVHGGIHSGLDPRFTNEELQFALDGMNRETWKNIENDYVKNWRAGNVQLTDPKLIQQLMLPQTDPKTLDHGHDSKTEDASLAAPIEKDYLMRQLRIANKMLLDNMGVEQTAVSEQPDVIYTHDGLHDTTDVDNDHSGPPLVDGGDFHDIDTLLEDAELSPSNFMAMLKDIFGDVMNYDRVRAASAGERFKIVFVQRGRGKVLAMVILLTAVLLITVYSTVAILK